MKRLKIEIEFDDSVDKENVLLLGDDIRELANGFNPKSCEIRYKEK